MTWHVIHGDDLLDALRKVQTGASPISVYAKLVTTATEREDYREETDDFNRPPGVG